MHLIKITLNVMLLFIDMDHSTIAIFSKYVCVNKTVTPMYKDRNE